MKLQFILLIFLCITTICFGSPLVKRDEIDQVKDLLLKVAQVQRDTEASEKIKEIFSENKDLLENVDSLVIRDAFKSIRDGTLNSDFEKYVQSAENLLEFAKYLDGKDSSWQRHSILDFIEKIHTLEVDKINKKLYLDKKGLVGQLMEFFGRNNQAIMYSILKNQVNSDVIDQAFNEFRQPVNFDYYLFKERGGILEGRMVNPVDELETLRLEIHEKFKDEKFYNDSREKIIERVEKIDKLIRKRRFNRVLKDQKITNPHNNLQHLKPIG